MAILKFYRGLEAKYNEAVSTYKDGIYFCTDSGKIFHNEKQYGGSSDKIVKDVTLDGTNLTIAYTDATNETLDLSKLSFKYRSAMDDELQIPNAIGGISAGTTAGDLKNKTIDQVLDDLLFPEVQPTVNAPSASILLKAGFSNDGVYEVGAPAPQNPTNFTTKFNRGRVTCPGKPDQWRAGELKEADSFIYVNFSPSAKTLPAKVGLGKTTYTYLALYAQGDELITSKGNGASVKPNPLPAGNVDSNNVAIHGTYPYFCNGAQASENANAEADLGAVAPDTKLTLKTWETTQIYAKFASEASTGTRLVFKYPSTKRVTKVEFLNTVSGKFEDFTSYETSEAGNMEVQGSQIAYTQLTTKGALSGALKLRFTLADA